MPCPSGKTVEKVLNTVEATEADLIALVRKFISTPSLTGKEGPAQKMVAELLSGLGFEVDLFEPDIDELRKHWAYEGDSSAYFEYGYKGRPNVVGQLRGSGGGRSVVFYTHIDTVPPGPIETWHHDPFGAEIEDGKLYGRGTADMKSGLPCVLTAIKCIQRLGLKLKGDIQITSTIEEQISACGGTLAVLAKGYRADAAVIPHPIEAPDKLIIARGGMCVFKIRVTGVTMHSTKANLGVSALDKMFKIYKGFREFGDKRTEELRYPLFEKAGYKASTLNIGLLRSGELVQTVPGWAEMEGRISLIPGEKVEEMKKTLEGIINKIADEDDWLRKNRPKVEWPFQVVGYETKSDEPLVKVAAEAIETVTRKKPDYIGIPIHGDGRFYYKFGIPQISIGPAAGNMMGPDEFVVVEDLMSFSKIVAKIIIDWCGLSAI